MEGEAMHKTQILSLSSLQMMLYLEKQMRPGGGGSLFYRVLDVKGDPGSRRGPIHAYVWEILHISHPGTEKKGPKKQTFPYCC